MAAGGEFVPRFFLYNVKKPFAGMLIFSNKTEKAMTDSNSVLTRMTLLMTAKVLNINCECDSKALDSLLFELIYL